MRGMGRRTAGRGAVLTLVAMAGAGPLHGQEVERTVDALRQALVAVRAGVEARMTTLHTLHTHRALRSQQVQRSLQVERVARELAEVRAAVAVRLAGRGVDGRAAVPAPWLAQDPADSLYRAARERLNGGRYEAAAALFQEIRDRHPRSGYVGDSYYFQALALQRAGGSQRLERALALLSEQARRYEETATARDARALEVRIRGDLARGGDAEAAASITRQATAPCEGEEQEMRSAALSALLQMDSERAVPLLRDVLRSRGECSAELRKQAVFLVAQKMDDETVDILLDLAHRDPDPDPEVREAAVFWLSQVRSPEAVEALESILLSSTDREIQEKAVFALSQHRSGRTSRVLREFAGRGDAPVELRESAIFWIGQAGDEESRRYLRELYGSLGHPDLKEKVIFGVAQNPSQADRAWLLERARDGSETVELRKNALFWAGQSGSVPVADLGGLYRSLNEREMKEQIVFVLSQQQDNSEAVDLLMEIAGSEEDVELRKNAVFWLGQSDDPRAAEFLVRFIQGGGR